jgi:transposase
MGQLDGIRLQRFRQLKNEIRGSDEYLIVGIDVAKERHNGFFGTAAGRTLHKGLFFANTIEGFQKLLTIIEALKVKHDLTKVVFGLEPTSSARRNSSTMSNRTQRCRT